MKLNLAIENENYFKKACKRGGPIDIGHVLLTRY